MKLSPGKLYLTMIVGAFIWAWAENRPTEPAKPRFKPGDCISHFGLEMQVEKVRADGLYFLIYGSPVLLGAYGAPIDFCDSVDALNQPYLCNRVAYEVKIVDENAELRKCKQ